MTAGELAHEYPGVVRALERAEAMERAHIRENAVHRAFLRYLIGVLGGTILLTVWSRGAGWEPVVAVYALIVALSVLVALWLFVLHRVHANADDA